MKQTAPTRPLAKAAMAALLAATCVAATSCHKNCVCIGYNGAERTYTAEEVDERGVTCANMVMQAGQQYYSVCSWE